MNLIQYIRYFFMSVVVLMLIGCGGGDSGGSATSSSDVPTTTITGTFIDDAVQGLNYSCSSGKDGITNADGTYTCNTGDNVTFKIGDLTLGTVAAQTAPITPYSLFPNDVNKAIDLARLLQTLNTKVTLNVITLNKALLNLIPLNTVLGVPSFQGDMETALSLALVSAGEAQSTMNNAVAVAGGSIPTNSNNMPVANAGVDQNISTTSTVTLDASNSSDYNSDSLTYTWSITSRPNGSSATLSSTTELKPTFVADLDGQYIFSLVVNDGLIDSSSDTIVVFASVVDAATDISFDIMEQTGVSLSAIVEVDVNNLSTISKPTAISVSSGSSYRLNGGIYTDDVGVLNENDTLQVRHISSKDYNSSVSTTLTIGEISKLLKSTTVSESTSVETLNVMDYGATGNGITDDSVAISNAIAQARTEGKDVYFPNGSYLHLNSMYTGGVSGYKVRLIGESKIGTILISEDNSINHQVTGAENMTFQDFKMLDSQVGQSRIFRNCKFETTILEGNTFYQFYQGFYTEGVDFEFTDCDFVFPHIYTALYLRKYNSVLIRNCTFNGNAWHNIRLSEPYIRNAQVSIIENTITGGTTGIFIGSSRSYTHEAGLIEGNTLINQREESIGLDGFGNNAGLIPVIANGPIHNVWNDSDGRVVISMAEMVYATGPYAGDVYPSPISLRNDWTKFYFSFGEGSGQEGMIVRIQDFNVIDNTLTLDLNTPASSINIGGDAGVQSGFFNWIVRKNKVSWENGYISDYAQPAGISIYLNVFGTLIEDNNVSNVDRALVLTGGQMLTHYRSLAYSNVVRNNIFQDNIVNLNLFSRINLNATVLLMSLSANPVQYNNQFINNTIDIGRVFIQKQENFTMRDNTLGVDVELILDP